MSRMRQGSAIVLGLILSLAAAHGQFASPEAAGVRSVSGQFFVVGASDTPVFRNSTLAANTNLVHLEPALLAVAAERFKASLWHQLGVSSDAAWTGKIYLALHPARSMDETVAIASSPFLKRWNYRVDFPDTLTRARYARAFSGVLLLEMANRNANASHSAEVPAWLVDGMAQQVLAVDSDQVLLAPPTKKRDGSPAGRVITDEKDFDALADARSILRNTTPLTFDELSWPADMQMMGADGGRYLASAQLFVTELLALKDGPEKMRAMLAELPAHMNWQTAFFNAFHDDFTKPLDVEKWWALRVIHFSTHSMGPRWTTDISRMKLQQALSVPVETRVRRDALPSHAEISLQAALTSLPRSQRDAVISEKMRDLALIELRLAPPFGGLADAYRAALAGFLGEVSPSPMVKVVNKHASTAPQRVNLIVILKTLDALDVRLRDAIARSTLPSALPVSSR